MFILSNSDGRYIAKCVVNYRKARIRDFVVDTGAKCTCCSYDYVDSRLCEDELSNARTKILGGFVADVGMKFYEIELEQFTIGTVDFGKQKIWITFDPRIADSLLGIDILSKAIFINAPMLGRIAVYENIREAIDDLKVIDEASQYVRE